MEHLDILYTIDYQYLNIFLVSLLSIIKNGQVNTIHCHVITKSFRREDYQYLYKFMKKYNNIEISCYPLEKFNIDRFKIPNWRGSQIANARLFFEIILNQNISNIQQLLYLDADTMIVDDLTNLNNYKNGIHAVKDLGIPKHPFNDVKAYYNSGVLWIDVEEWIKQNCQEKLIHFIENNTYPLQYPDQDVLNFGLWNELKELPREYNLSDKCFAYGKIVEQLYFYLKGIPYSEIINAKKNKKIIHFYGCEKKPWIEGTKNPFKKSYEELMDEINPNYNREIEHRNEGIFDKYPWLYYDLLLAKKGVSKQIKKLIKRCC